MPKLDRDGVGIYYEVHGEGPVVLLSHGYSATSQMWRGQVEPLSHGRRLVLWDTRGHGRSDYPADPAACNEAATVADMAALLDAVGATTAVVGGLSLGGYMSLAFNRVHPERTRAQPVSGLVRGQPTHRVPIGSRRRLGHLLAARGRHRNGGAADEGRRARLAHSGIVGRWWR